VVSLAQRVTHLEQFYGTLSAPPRDPFILFVWEVLSAHSSPRRADAALAALKRLRALTPDSMWKAPPARLEAAVRLAGPYLERRLQALRTGVEQFRRSPRLPAIIRGPLPAARRALKALPQLGQPGARRMLLFAADHAVVPIDAEVHRVMVRLGYGRTIMSGVADTAPTPKSVRVARAALTAEFGAGSAALRRAWLYLSHHGAATCTERDPHCSVCPLLEGCPEGERREQIV
jgi:endonuclease-3